MPDARRPWRGSVSASERRTIGRRRAALVSSLSFLALCLATTAVAAQASLQPGEAYLTRFSGAVAGPSGPMIDTSGTVGSILDIREPGRPPQGEHWVDEPQHRPVTAGEVGQVFGVVLDTADPPDVFLAATSAFGLHLAPGTTGWMAGQWGAGGGPGTIWRLVAADGYRPKRFAEVGVAGRANTGAALGNMAYDRIGRQIFVSDMESGLIHRIDAASGADLGSFDHGSTGRSRFVDAPSGRSAALPAIAFDPASRARISDCAEGAFETTPACWNLAASGRRVWGVGVRSEPGTRSRRLYYAVWSGPNAGGAWDQAAEEDRRSAVWSVGLTSSGDFDPADVRREFLLPDFFSEAKDVAAAGYSRPVADITFDECGSLPTMILAERGGHRNLGLGRENAFAFPHEARVLRYEMDQAGKWQPVGRYDVGYRDRRDDGKPFIRANAAGGAAFGYGYRSDFSRLDRNAPSEFLWMTGDSLCSPDAPCRAPGGDGDEAKPASTAGDAGADGSEVHGLQGLAAVAIDDLVPKGAYDAYPASGEVYPAVGPDQSWLIDADVNLRPDGTAIPEEFTRNDATHVGDVAIRQICNAPARTRSVDLLPVAPAPEIGTVIEVEGHDRVLTHAVVASHGATSSHFRIASHNPWLSHDRWRSHNRWRSHDVVMSRPIHRPVGSLHRPIGSAHRPIGSVHYPRGSVHRPVGSIHRPIGSWHKPAGSIHRPAGSIHRPVGSLHRPPGSLHKPPGSLHRPPGSVHNPPGSVHKPPGSVHRPPGSVHRPPGSVHRPAGSVHRPPGSLERPPVKRHRPVGSVRSHRPSGSIHRPAGSVRQPAVRVNRPSDRVRQPRQVRPQAPSVRSRPSDRSSSPRSGPSIRPLQP